MLTEPGLRMPATGLPATVYPTAPETDSGAFAGTLGRMLDEACVALTFFEPDQVDRLQASCATLLADGRQNSLTAEERLRLRRPCLKLARLLRHSQANLALLRLGTSNDFQRGYAWHR